MAAFADKETEEQFYQDILSQDLTDSHKTALIQDYMLIYHDESIATHYALSLLKLMGCDTAGLQNKSIEHRPVFRLNGAQEIMLRFTFD